jgi:hypothetical protein
MTSPLMRERVARVEIDAAQFNAAAMREEELHIDVDRTAARHHRHEHRPRQLRGHDDDVAHIPDARVVRDAQPPMRSASCPGFVDGAEIDDEMFQSALRRDP